MSRAPSFSNRAPPLTVLQFLSASFIAAPALFSDFISSLPPSPSQFLEAAAGAPREGGGEDGNYEIVRAISLLSLIWQPTPTHSKS